MSILHSGSDSDDSAIVIYTDDEENERVLLERFARMHLPEQTPSSSHGKKPSSSKATPDPPPPVPRHTRPAQRSPTPPASSVPALPSPTPPASPQIPPTAPLASPKTPSRLYAYQSSISPPSQTPHWHLAAAAMQGVPGGRQRSVIKRCKNPNNGRQKPTAYAVIRGRNVGVYTVWEGVAGARQHMNGFPFALYAGFPTRAAAQAALDFCVAAHWSLTLPVMSISLNLIPRPVRDENDLEGHAPRQPNDPCVESLLNVLGVSGGTHDSWPTYQEARGEFDDAMHAGTVSACRLS
ncbi:hypothetical protein C8F01DRAFT_1257850 [Mycena amicta]|nr:hypothetical protein C8F01DRAFT_1257850 [Mycena amicta]